MPVLKADPDWAGAAQALVSALEAQGDEDGRVEALEAVRDAFGDAVYPGFLKLLAAVGRFGDLPARRLVADTFARALSTSRMPAARVPAWGGGPGGLGAVGGLAAALGPAFAPAGPGLRGGLRAVGPLEFLCLWAHRDLAAEPLDADGFETALRWLLTLFDASSRAVVLYQLKLLADADSPVEGLHDRESRALVRALVAAWEGGGAPADVAGEARRALRRDPFAHLPR